MAVSANENRVKILATVDGIMLLCSNESHSLIASRIAPETVTKVTCNICFFLIISVISSLYALNDSVMHAYSIFFFKSNVILHYVNCLCFSLGVLNLISFFQNVFLQLIIALGVKTSIFRSPTTNTFGAFNRMVILETRRMLNLD